MKDWKKREVDLVEFDDPVIREVMWRSYGDHLESLGGPEYRQKLLDCVDREDAPRSLAYRLRLV